MIQRRFLRKPYGRASLLALAVLFGATAGDRQAFASAEGLTPKMEQQIKAFLGVTAKGHQCLDRPKALYAQAIEQIRLPDRPFLKVVDPDTKMFSGGKPHDFNDSTALIYDGKDNIKAIAITGCDWDGASGQRTRSVRIFLYVKKISERASVLSALMSWRAFDANLPILTQKLR